ncbi:MAG: hypothetical protein JKY65_04225 [Planctomycetes bacterium]|nr:hypothetical protein [Planctomycetota bacterium]
MTHVRNNSLRCPYCHDAITGPGPKTGCEACLAWHHTACFRELGRCGNCSAAAEPPAVAPEVLRAAMSEIIASGCQSHGCRAIDTLEVKGMRLCGAHAKGPVWTLNFLAALSGVIAAGFVLASMQIGLSSPASLVASLFGLLLLIVATLFFRHVAKGHLNAVRDALAEAEAEDAASEPADVDPSPRRSEKRLAA